MTPDAEPIPPARCARTSLALTLFAIVFWPLSALIVPCIVGGRGAAALATNLGIFYSNRSDKAGRFASDVRAARRQLLFFHYAPTVAVVLAIALCIRVHASLPFAQQMSNTTTALGRAAAGNATVVLSGTPYNSTAPESIVDEKADISWQMLWMQVIVVLVVLVPRRVALAGLIHHDAPLDNTCSTLQVFPSLSLVAPLLVPLHSATSLREGLRIARLPVSTPLMVLTESAYEVHRFILAEAGFGALLPPLNVLRASFPNGVARLPGGDPYIVFHGNEASPPGQGNEASPPGQGNEASPPPGQGMRSEHTARAPPTAATSNAAQSASTLVRCEDIVGAGAQISTPRAPMLLNVAAATAVPPLALKVSAGETSPSPRAAALQHPREHSDAESISQTAAVRARRRPMLGGGAPWFIARPVAAVPEALRVGAGGHQAPAKPPPQRGAPSLRRLAFGVLHRSFSGGADGEDGGGDAHVISTSRSTPRSVGSAEELLSHRDELVDGGNPHVHPLVCSVRWDVRAAQVAVQAAGFVSLDWMATGVISKINTISSDLQAAVSRKQ